MSRRTVRVADVLRWVNIRLGTPRSSLRLLENMTPEQAFRLGQASLLEQILHATGNYAGFGYQETPYVHGVSDETRRVYYVASRLRADYEAAEAEAKARRGVA